MECEAFCSTAGGIGSLARTFDAEQSICHKCECLYVFFSLEKQRVADNYISGRFVDEDDPTDNTCRDNCRFQTGGTSQAYIDNLNEFVTTCNDGSNKGCVYNLQLDECDCLDESFGSPEWDSQYDTVIFADTEQTRQIGN